MKILITNVYCYMNKGDAGIVVAMVQQLRKVFDNPQITICSLYPDLDKGKYGDNVRVIAPPIHPIQDGSKLKRLSHNMNGFLKTFIMQKLKIDGNEFLEALNSSDLVLSCGGGFMQCRSVKEFLSDFIYHYTQLELVRLVGKKYFIFAQTVGPFSSFVKVAITKIMNSAEAVLARESISFNYVKNSYPKAKLFNTADIAFLLKKEKQPMKFLEDKIKVGVTVREWSFPGTNNRKQAQENYIRAFVEFFDSTMDNNKYEFYLMPQVIGPGKDNDLVYSQKILNRTKSKNIRIIKDDLDPRKIKYIYSKMDYFIGTRMHSNIFSLSEYIPCLAISYDYKTDGIMKMAGQQDYLIKIENISAKLLNEKFQAMVHDKNYKEKLRLSVPKIKEKAKLNLQIVKDNIEK